MVPRILGELGYGGGRVDEDGTSYTIRIQYYGIRRHQ